MLGSSSSSQRPQRHYSTKKVQSLLHASHPLTPWSYIWKKQIFSTGVISYSQVSNHEGPHQANIITSRGFVKIWQELLSPKHIFACCSKPRQDQGEAYRDTKRGLFKGLSWDNWAAHWEQGELETELHGVQCSGSHLGLKITQCYNCERLGKLEPEVLCKAKKVANGHWPSKDNDVTSQVKWKCWSSSGREGFFTTFLTTHCMCGHVSVSVGVSVGGLPQDILPVSPPPPSSCCCILTEYYWHRTWTFSCVYWASITLANWVSMVHSYWVSIRYFHKVYHVINIWCHVSVIDFFEPIIPPAMWDFFTQPIKELRRGPNAGQAQFS